MKPDDRALFTETIVRDAATRFGLDTDGITPLDGFENFVCEGVCNGKPVILRLTHSSHRTADQITAELDWVDYLASHRISVCVPLRSHNDRLVETTDTDDATISAVVFEKAPGRMVRRDDQTQTMTINRGRLLGRIHALTKAYTPPQGHSPRPHWHENSDIVDFRDMLKPSDAIVADQADELIARLKSLPDDHDSYGLIHTDAHTGNMFFDGDRPTLFDFDDSTYDFFISDIAIALFYAILFLPKEHDYEEYARQFLRDMLTGYRQENSIDPSWLEIIPAILKRREIILYVAIHRGFDLNDPGEWATRYLAGRRERIEKDAPVLEIDFAACA